VRRVKEGVLLVGDCGWQFFCRGSVYVDALIANVELGHAVRERHQLGIVNAGRTLELFGLLTKLSHRCKVWSPIHPDVVFLLPVLELGSLLEFLAILGHEPERTHFGAGV